MDNNIVIFEGSGVGRCGALSMCC